MMLAGAEAIAREHNLAAKAAKEGRQSLITNTAYATVESYS